MAAIGRGLPVPAEREGLLGRLRPNAGVLAAALILASAAVFPVFVNSGASGRGKVLGELGLEQRLLAGEIRQLEADIANLTALDRIERDARALGMTESTRAYYIAVDVAPPADLEVPDAFRTRPSQPEGASGQPWWREVVDWLPFP